MTLLQRPETPTGDPELPEGGLTNPGALTLGRIGELSVAALAGAACVLLGALLVAVPTLVTWAVESRSSSSFWETVGASVDLWAMAHRAEVRTPAADLVLAPLLLTAVLVGLCWYAARQLVRGSDHLMARVPHIGGWRSAWHAMGGQEATAFMLGYVVAGLALAHTASFGIAPVWLPSLIPGAILVPLLGVVLVWWSEHRRDEHPGVDAALRWVELRAPAPLRRAIAPARQALLVLALGSFLLVLALLLLRGERVLDLYGALDAGIVGSSVLTVAQLLAIPNAMVWALSWMTGAGLQIGTVEVGWAATAPGDLPLLPILGALPEAGPMPSWAWAGVLLPVIAGVWIGIGATRASSRLATWWSKTKIALCATALVAAGALVLGWAATGGLTPGLLGTIGVDALLFAALLGVEVGAAAVLTVSLVHLVGSGRRMGRSSRSHA